MYNPATKTDQKLDFGTPHLKVPKLLNPKFYLALIFPLLFILSLVQMIASNRLATEGEDIRQIEIKRQSLADENKDLTNQIATESSLSSLNLKVSSLGMKKSEKVIVLGPQKVASIP